MSTDFPRRHKGGATTVLGMRIGVLIGILAAFPFIFFGGCMALLILMRPSREPVGPGNPTPQPKTYTIIAEKDLSYPGTRRISVDVRSETRGIPGRSELETMAEEVWAQKGRGFDEGWVCVYLPTIDASLGAYSVAHFDAGALQNIQVREELLEIMEIRDGGRLDP